MPSQTVQRLERGSASAEAGTRIARSHHSNTTVSRSRRQPLHGSDHPRPLAVRDHDGLPLLLRAPHHRPRLGRGRPADGLVRDRRRRLEAPHEVLGEALPHQLRDGRRHRHRPGVPVRDELVRVLALRRRRLRRAPRDRGARRVLPRVDVPRPVDLRLGPPLEEGPPRLDLARRDRRERLRAVDPHRELVHAAAGGLRRSQRPRRDGELLGPDHESPRLRAVPPRDHGRDGDRRILRPRPQRVARTPGPGRRVEATPSPARSGSARSTRSRRRSRSWSWAIPRRST